MGLSGISPMSLILILLIVLVLFGGRRLRSLGSDLGGAIKGFRGAMHDAEAEEAAKSTAAVEDSSVKSAGQGARDAERRP